MEVNSSLFMNKILNYQHSEAKANYEKTFNKNWNVNFDEEFFDEIL